jgi:hypothetical protein
MYIVEFHNLKPNDEVVRRIDAHRLSRPIRRQGMIIAVGPKVLRTGDSSWWGM